jgi:CDGSH-type Zn-finger protein
MSEVKVDLKPNGPILINGPITLNDTQGNAYDLGSKSTIALCRCGATNNKPFCDGSPNGCGFESQEVVG